MSKYNLTKCDDCKFVKSPIIYLRSSRKICAACWKAEKETAKSLIQVIPEIIDKEPPLGYHFIVNDWFIDNNKGRKYANHVYANFSVCLS